MKKHKSKTNPKFFTDIPEEIPKEKRTEKRFDILLSLSELRRKQISSGDKIKILREDLIEERKNLAKVSEDINRMLDSLK